MTIIQPNKSSFKMNFLVIFVIGFIILEAILGIFAYSKSVRLSYLIKQEQKSIQHLEVENAEFKNHLYAALDFQNVEKIASELGLVKEKKPDYLAKND